MKRKLTAILCAASVLFCMTACSHTESEAEAEKAPDGNSVDVSAYDNAVLWAVAEPAAAGDATVTVTVQLAKNAGFDVLGMRLYYDAALTPVIGDAQNGVEYEDGTVTEGTVSVTSRNEEERIIGYASMGVQTVTGNGSVFSCQFTLPSDAKTGDSYTLQCETADYLLSEAPQDISCLTTSFTLN